MESCGHIDCQAPAVTSLRDYLKIEKKTLDKPVYFCLDHIEIFAHWYSLYQPEWVVTGTVKQLGKPFRAASPIEQEVRIHELHQAITWRECFQVPYLFLLLLLGAHQTRKTGQRPQMVHQNAQETSTTTRR